MRRARLPQRCHGAVTQVANDVFTWRLMARVRLAGGGGGVS
jgi:hypothetical protein